jgi:hypothetical protein
MKKNESVIEQINLGYNHEEDRLLLKLGLADKTEVAVWITRRVFSSMWNSLQNVKTVFLLATMQLTTPKITTVINKDQAIGNFMREAAEIKSVENMDFKSAYDADRQARTKQPMLAVQCTLVPAENTPQHLELQCKDGQVVNIALSTELTHAMTNMMQLATRESGWDLALDNHDTQTSLNLVPLVLH